MRSSLIVLAIVLATLRVVQDALASRVRRAALLPAGQRRRPVIDGASELRLVEGLADRSGTAGAGRAVDERNSAAIGDRASTRFAEWRYYGFSGHIAVADDSDIESPEVVASPPSVGSVVSILPDDCITTVVNGRVYRQCGSVWYQRQYTGSKVTYVVVPAP